MTALSFKGKEFVYNHHLAVPFRPLVPHPDKGIGPASLDGNLIIQGDNLHALKALLPYYAGNAQRIVALETKDDQLSGNLELVGTDTTVEGTLILMSEWRARLPAYLEGGVE